MPIIGVIASSAKGAPAAPIIGTATDVGTSRAYNNGAATVTFTAGAGATATSFTATSSPGGFTATGASSPLTVTGLQSNVSYTFTVTASNASGTSPASSASNSITATTVPQAPTIGTATAGDTTASITFTAGATGGKAVSTYTATSSPSSITGTNSASPITVSGLTNGTAYTFTVTATNANGTSAASSASNSITPEVASNFYNLATASGGSVTATISGIPSGYKYYMVRAICRSAGSGIADLALRINGGTATNYRNIVFQPTDSGANNLGSDSTNTYFSSALSGTSQNGWTVLYILFSGDNNSQWITSNTWGALTKTASTTSAQIILGACQYQTTSALSSITFENWNGTAFATGSSFALYGVS